ncbi:Hypothetical protein D9617_48g089460 [Elsinoe fawcettii]|nr:Hypothetical protein D9617_48g089460 [Elsinoe fawcettii]
MAPLSEQIANDYGSLLDLGLSRQLLDTIEAKHNIQPTRVTSRVTFFNSLQRLLMSIPSLAAREAKVEPHHLEQALDEYYRTNLRREDAHKERMARIMLSKGYFGKRRIITVETQCTALWDLSEVFTDVWNTLHARPQSPKRNPRKDNKRGVRRSKRLQNQKRSQNGILKRRSRT